MGVGMLICFECLLNIHCSLYTRVPKILPFRKTILTTIVIIFNKGHFEIIGNIAGITFLFVLINSTGLTS